MLVPSQQVKLTWNEPPLFQLRASSKTAWWLRGLFFFAIYALFAVLLRMDHKTSGPAFTPVGKLVMPAIIATVFLAMFEAPTLRRVVSIGDGGISCTGAFMMAGGPIHWVTGMRHWNWRELKQVHLLRPGEPGNAFDFGLMMVTPKYARPKQLAVAPTMALNDVADCLHAMNAEVVLSDWRPPAV